MSKSLDGVVPELRQRVEYMLARGNGALVVSSGLRTTQKQQQLWDDKVAEFINKGYSIERAVRETRLVVAYPGTSKHERGLAVDIECEYRNFELRKQLAKEAGLHTPVKGELWHMELAPGRGPIPVLTTPAAPKAAAQMNPEEKVDACLCPTGGVWTIQRDGGIRAMHGAPFYGSYWSLRPEQRQGERRFIAIEATADGYCALSDDDNAYFFNPQLWEDIRPK